MSAYDPANPKTRYVIVENAGYEGENVAFEFETYKAALGKFSKLYDEDDREKIHPEIAKVLPNGDLTYDY